MKNLPRRYVSEESVKKALKLDSFRNLSKEKVMQFASMIPYMDKEVAIAIINQFPVNAFDNLGLLRINDKVPICVFGIALRSACGLLAPCLADSGTAGPFSQKLTFQS